MYKKLVLFSLRHTPFLRMLHSAADRSLPRSRHIHQNSIYLSVAAYAVSPYAAFSSDKSFVMLLFIEIKSSCVGQHEKTLEKS